LELDYTLAVERNATYDLKFTKSGYAEERRGNVNFVDGTMTLSDVVIGYSFAGGSGTEQSPYLISTPGQLNNVRNNLSAHYKLTGDIDLADWGNWEPIGRGGPDDDWKNIFRGLFDGNGYIIKNMCIYVYGGNWGSQAYFGLFGYVAGTIKNIGMVDFTIDVTYSRHLWVGGIAGANNFIIDNCYSIGKISTTSSNEINFVGGVVGGNYGIINNCYNLGEIKATSIKYGVIGPQAGGIAGDNSNSGSINNCQNAGAISAIATDTYSSAQAGGIAGNNFSTTINSNSSTISSCYNIGTVSANLPDPHNPNRLAERP